MESENCIFVVTIIIPAITKITAKYPIAESLSLNSNTARNTEKRISPFSNNAESEAVVSSNPTKNRIGPTTAPDNAIAINNPLSCNERELVFFERGVATIDAKKYTSEASNIGCMSTSAGFATVETEPNNKAAKTAEI